MSKPRPKKSQKKSNRRRKLREAQTPKTRSPKVAKNSRRSERIQQQVNEQRNRLSTWYLSRSLPVKIALGLIVIPILIALFLLQGVILPFLAAAFGIFFAFSKVAIIWLKGPAFIVYISYKIFKTLLGIYYCVSRSITGWKAERQRRIQAKVEPSLSAAYPQLKVIGIDPKEIELSASIKSLKLNFKGQETILLFSYLRYFLIGQLFMYASFWKERYAFLTLWRAVSRQKVKEIFSHVGGTIFTPHLLGAHLNKKRVLVPGDSCLIAIRHDSLHTEILHCYFEVSWQEWRFSKTWPLISADRSNEFWCISLPLNLDSISEDKIGYVLNRVENDAI